MANGMRPDLSEQRILVTGAGGFLGSHLSRRLVSLGMSVHGTTRSARASGTDGLEWWHTTLHNPAEVKKLLRRVMPDVIVHLSGHVTAGPTVDLVLPTFQSLLADTVNLLTGVVESDCGRVVLVGSLTEPQVGGAPDRLIPGSPYVAAKWAATAYGQMFHALYDTPVVIARLSMTYGPGQDQQKLIPYVVRSLLRGESPRLSDGRLLADWTYIDDMVDGLLRSALIPNLEGETFDLGSGVLTSVREVVRQIIQLLDTPLEPEWGALPDRPDEYVRAANAARTEELLHWKAGTSLKSGLEKTIEALRKSYGYA
ncbi:MAG: NAD(P)-dependent oxidoreductase [Gemmatimonadales bacterium]|nr:NAD(P)-dependent oxidoreductase [Gemmatimonadales bacterium]